MSIYPSKVNYTTGQVLTASEMNEIGQAINLVDGAQTSGAKNRVLNSNMSVWQRGTSFTALTASTATTDRWYINPGVSGGSGAVTRQTTSDTTNLPFIQYCARVQRTSGNTNTNPFYFANSFESVNSIPLAGKTVTLSYYARAGANYSAASGALIGSVYTGTGTDQGWITTGYTGQAQPVTSTVTLTTTWQRFSVTGTLAATATEVSVVFQNTPVGTAGANDWYEVTGVQLEAANTASPYAPNGATYQAELAACQRYYYRITASATYSRFPTLGTGISTTAVHMPITLPVTMRTTPATADTGGAFRVYDGVGVVSVSSVTLIGSTDIGASNTAYISANLAAGATVYRPYMLTADNSATAYIGFGAEL